MPPGLVDRDAGGPAIDPNELGTNPNLDACPEEYVLEFHHGLGGSLEMMIGEYRWMIMTGL